MHCQCSIRLYSSRRYPVHARYHYRKKSVLKQLKLYNKHKRKNNFLLYNNFNVSTLVYYTVYVAIEGLSLLL